MYYIIIFYLQKVYDFCVLEKIAERGVGTLFKTLKIIFRN